jgi:type IV pilus assembly protein PilM
MFVFSLLSRIFPPPRLLTLPSVGVDISESSLKYVQFHARNGVRSLARWGDIALAPGVVGRGAIVETKGVVEALKKVRALCKTPYVRVSLPEERAYLFETTIERGTPEKDIRNLLEFRMEENVPLSPRDAFFDYDFVADAAGENHVHIGVAVYAKEIMLSYYDACRQAELLPISLEVEADAIARAAVPTGEKGVYMVLDIGRMRSGLAIAHRHTVLYTSTIDIGGQHFSDALRRQLGDQDDAALVTLKNERGLLHSGEASDVYEALLPPVAALRDEIATRISYWNTRSIESGGRAIEKVVLCGGSINMAGLPEYLAETLGIETERVDVWKNVFGDRDIVPPITRRYSYGYATAIGLALRDSIEQAPL